MKAVLVVASLTLAITPIVAQNSPGRPDSRPVVLLPGLGQNHHPNLTTNSEAHKFFDQGLILVRPE